MTPTELADALDREADRGITELPNRIVDLLTQASHALRRLGADAATLTHRAEVAEAKVREYDSWVCWETNCGHMAKALDMIYSAEASNDAANDAAALWRERCNKAEERASAANANNAALRSQLDEADADLDRLRAALATYEEG